MADRKHEQRRFFYQVMGQTIGPISGRELRERAVAGDLNQFTLVRIGETGQWVPAERLKGFFHPDGTPVHHEKLSPELSYSNEDSQNSVADTKLAESRDSNTHDTREDVVHFTRVYFQRHITAPRETWDCRIYYARSIPKTKAAKAASSYAMHGGVSETSLVLYDDTLVGTATKGFVLTDQNLYTRLREKRLSGYRTIKLRLANVRAIEFKKGLSCTTIAINGIPFAIATQLRSEHIAPLNDFFFRLICGNLIVPGGNRNKGVELFEDEEVAYRSHGANSLTALDHVLCTNKRLIILDHELWGIGGSFQEFEYGDITAIRIKKDGLGIVDSMLGQCTLEVHVSGSVFTIDNIGHMSARTILRIVREHKHKLRTNEVREVKSSSLNSRSIAEELGKLVGLRDSGALTEDEFAAAKKRLLDAQ